MTSDAVDPLGPQPVEGAARPPTGDGGGGLNEGPEVVCPSASYDTDDPFNEDQLLMEFEAFMSAAPLESANQAAAAV